MAWHYAGMLLGAPGPNVAAELVSATIPGPGNLAGLPPVPGLAAPMRTGSPMPAALQLAHAAAGAQAGAAAFIPKLEPGRENASGAEPSAVPGCAHVPPAAEHMAVPPPHAHDAGHVVTSGVSHDMPPPTAHEHTRLDNERVAHVPAPPVEVKHDVQAPASAAIPLPDGATV